MPGIYWYVISKKTANSFKETVSSLKAERRHCNWFKLPTIQNRLFRPRDQNGSTSSKREKKWMSSRHWLVHSGHMVVSSRLRMVGKLSQRSLEMYGTVRLTGVWFVNFQSFQGAKCLCNMTCIRLHSLLTFSEKGEMWTLCMKHERCRRFLRRWTMDAQVQVMGGGGVYKSHGNFPDQWENFSFNERKFLQRTVEKFFTPIKEGLSK